MIMIQAHRYARFEKVNLHASPSCDAEVISILQKGDWMGVLQLQSGWSQVVGPGFHGWIQDEDTEFRPPFQLHAKRLDPNTIKYYSREQQS